MNTNSSKKYKLILISLWLTNIFGPFLSSGVNTLLPVMGKDLDASAVDLSLVLLLYILAQAIFSILGGRFGDFLGHKRVLLASASIFFISTLFISFAENLPFLLFLRFIQGLSTAILASCCTVIGISMSPPEKRSQTIGILVSAVYLGLALGPLIFGYIASTLSWRYAFGFLLIPGVPLMILLEYSLDSVEANEKIAIGESFDTLGALLLTLGLAIFTLGIGGLHIHDNAIWAIFIGIITLCIFIYHQWHTKFPTIDLRTLSTSEGFWLGLLIMFLNFGSIMGLIYFFTIYLQDIRGLSPFEAGCFLALQSLTQIIASPIGGRLSDKYSPAPIIGFGMLLCSMSIFALAYISMTTSFYYISFWFLFLGFGIGVSNPPTMSYALANIHKKQLSVAIGLTGSIRTMGALLSYSLILIIIANYLGDKNATDDIPAFFQSMQLCFTFFTLSCFSGSLILFYKILAKKIQ